jgi:NADPH-dependent F420 reductase
MQAAADAAEPARCPRAPSGRDRFFGSIDVLLKLFRAKEILGCWLCALVAAGPACADTIAMIGTGNVGSALGVRFAELGHTIVYGSRDAAAADVAALVARTGARASAASQAEAASRGDVVVLAVPWDAVEEVTRSLGNLAGKIVIDPTNPRITAPDGLRDYALDTSNAERIQRLAPTAKVVKAFNTLGSETMLDPRSAGGPVTIPIVGDDAAAKADVIALARGIGLEALDVGPLRHARIVEGLHYLRQNAVGGPVDFHLRPETGGGAR